MKKILVTLTTLFSFMMWSNIVNANDPYEMIQQRNAIEKERVAENELWRDEQLEFFMMVEQKRLQALVVNNQLEKIDMEAKKFTAQRKNVANITKEIQTFKKKNKNISKGTKAQKERYQKQYKALQTKLANEKKKTNILKNNVLAEQKKYQQLKTEFIAFDQQIDVVRQQMYVMQDKVTSLINKRADLNKKLSYIGLPPEEVRLPEPIITIPSSDAPPVDVEATSLTPDEKALADTLNEYRLQQGLQALTISKSLTKVARTHVNDSNQYHKSFEEHPIDKYACTIRSWSENGPWTDVCYFEGHKYFDKTDYLNMLNKPEELTNYKGIAIEIGFVTGKEATPEAAVEYWLNKSGDHRIITGARNFAQLSTMGVAINGSYAYVWFGFDKDPEGYY